MIDYETQEKLTLAKIRIAELETLLAAANAALTRSPAPVGVEYDRELIAKMLEDAALSYDMGAGIFNPDSIREQIRLLCEADNRDAAGVRTASRDPVGGLPKGVVIHKVNMGRGDERYIGVPSGNGATVGDRGHHHERILFELADALLGALAQQARGSEEL